jgi:hypothetical protein
MKNPRAIELVEEGIWAFYFNGILFEKAREIFKENLLKVSGHSLLFQV